ncbi:MAG: hypothetical protein U0231_04720 [Nitrospiraceae bacterium]
MKIRKKAPKPSPSKPPLYLIGYRYSAPSLDELKIWYDLEYGGPLNAAPGEPGNSSALSHGPWHARLLMRMPESEGREVAGGADLGSRGAHGRLTGRNDARHGLDTVLFAARVARNDAADAEHGIRPSLHNSTSIPLTGAIGR